MLAHRLFRFVAFKLGLLFEEAMSFLGHKHGHGPRITDSQHGKEARNMDRDDIIHGGRTSGMVHFHGGFKYSDQIVCRDGLLCGWVEIRPSMDSTTILFQRNQCGVPTPFKPKVTSINIFHSRRNVHEHTEILCHKIDPSFCRPKVVCGVGLHGKVSLDIAH